MDTMDGRADAVLALFCRGRRRDAYSGAQLLRKERTDIQRAVQTARVTPRALGTGEGGFSARRYLMRRELDGLMRAAGLSARERGICLLSVQGCTQEEIAAAAGLSRRSLRRILVSLRWRIRQARQSYPYAGLWEVYEESTGG